MNKNIDEHVETPAKTRLTGHKIIPINLCFLLSILWSFYIQGALSDYYDTSFFCCCLESETH